MGSLADFPEIIGFFSYSREDDDDSKGALSGLRDRIQRELRGQLGRGRADFRLWQDTAAIAHGTLWEDQIKSAVAQSLFFIPIVTPTALRSRHCKFEFESFLARESELGRADLVFPVLYIRVPALEDEMLWRGDPVLGIIRSRQYLDWRELRFRNIDSPEVGVKIEQFCRNVFEALHLPYLTVEERRQNAAADAVRRADEEDRRQEEAAVQMRTQERQRQEAEARRISNEEQRRQNDEARRQAEERQRRGAEAKPLADEEQRRKGEEARRKIEHELAPRKANAYQQAGVNEKWPTAFKLVVMPWIRVETPLAARRLTIIAASGLALVALVLFGVAIFAAYDFLNNLSRDAEEGMSVFADAEGVMYGFFVLAAIFGACAGGIFFNSRFAAIVSVLPSLMFFFFAAPLFAIAGVKGTFATAKFRHMA
jgi:hypothetical protein